MADLHPDPFYKYHSSTEEDDACHRGRGPAGVLGAETTDCDSPISLINETFKWIEQNLKDEIDFVVWTGDSARHDNDERIPRSEEQVSDSNEFLVNKFLEVFGEKENFNDTNPFNDFAIPIIPTFGNNDILPHNIFAPGPNRWTKKFLSIWRPFIPEEQRHGFEKGGWFSVEAIPNHLAVFSLNTLYFFDSNSAIDGCSDKSEPGHLQMEWLRIQLQFLRQRGMKAILIGHVPPARTESKLSWDETCWQKYTLWMHQYRDVVVGSLYGHMNIDHFMLQDSKDVDILDLETDATRPIRTALDDDLTTQSAADYLTELRAGWSQLPNPPELMSLQHSNYGSNKETSEAKMSRVQGQGKKNKKPSGGKKSKKDKFLHKIGGEWGERYSLSLVAPSVVPNYFPTLRVVEYNITGLDELTLSSDAGKKDQSHFMNLREPVCNGAEEILEQETLAILKNQRKMKGNQDTMKQKVKVPKSPSKSSPPGPAYSPQTLSWLGYTQYYANLTVINNDFASESGSSSHGGLVEDEGWKEGKHRGKHPKDKGRKLKSKDFKYEVEYDTKDDKTFGLKDLTVRSYISLAARIGQYKPHGNRIGLNLMATSASEGDDKTDDRTTKDKKHKQKRKHSKGKGKGKGKKRKDANQAWLTFVRRAFVGTQEAGAMHGEGSEA